MIQVSGFLPVSPFIQQCLPKCSVTLTFIMAGATPPTVELLLYVECQVFFSQSHYAPNFEEVDRAYWFQVVSPCVCACFHSSRTVHARVLKFHIWIPHGKIFDVHFFSCPSYLPFWSYAPLNKIGMKSDACHIL